MYLRVTEDMSTKLRKKHRSATDKAADCYSQKYSSIFLVKIRVSQPDGLQAAIITIFCTQVLDLGMIILQNVAVNPALDAVKLQVAKFKKYADQ